MSDDAALRERFLRSSAWIDWRDPNVLEQASALARGRPNARSIAEACFLWVRDHIPHSGDHALEPLTRSASEVLRHGTGICYPKSHLLAALLRANGIPAGLAYQRLAADARPGGFCLHGLNGVWLEPLGWYRLDARGARADLVAQFTPPREALPYRPSRPGECTFDGLWSEPVAAVRHALERSRSRAQLDVPDAVDLGPPDVPLAP